MDNNNEVQNKSTSSYSPIIKIKGSERFHITLVACRGFQISVDEPALSLYVVIGLVNELNLP